MTTDTTTAAPSTPPPPPRKSGLRIVRWIFLVLLLVILVGGAVLYFKLNEIVRRTVEKQSTNSLNQKTELQSANVSILGGNVRLNNFKISSPAGFEIPEMMTLGAIAVDTSFGELRQDPVRISSIDIEQPKMVIEMKGTSFNIKKFIDSLPPGEDKPPAEGGEPLKLVIGALNVKGATVVMRPDVATIKAVPGADKLDIKSEYTLKIPDIAMKDIGTGEGSKNGAAVKDVVTLLVREMAAKAAQSEQLPPELRQLLSMNVADITALAKAKLGEEVNKQIEKLGGELSEKVGGEAGKALEGVLKNPQEAAKDPGKTLQQGLGNILGGKKDEKTPPPATTPKK
jgi:hypothetical protein